MSSPAGPGFRWGALAATAATSLALHAGGLALASRLEPRPAAKVAPVEVEFEAVTPPAREPSPPRAAPTPPAPTRIRFARLEPRPATPPPPPSEAPPPAAASPARSVPRVGISLSSTAEGGSFAVGVGNTLHGKPPEVAADPGDVRPYAAQGTAPPPPSAQPRLLEQPEVPYPPEARHAGVEGRVRLLLHIDAQGRVVSARVLSDPGAGLGEAARAGALRFRFSPGLLDGQPVEVPDFPYTYTFVLE